MLSLIRKEVGRAGGIRALSREWEINPSYLSDVLRGRRDPGPAMTRHFGLKVKRVFVRDESAA